MTTAIRLALLVTLAGCAWPNGRPWSTGDYAAQVATLGMYGLSKNPGELARWDVEQCVQQGGDPAECRCAVYGCARTNVTVTR